MSCHPKAGCVFDTRTPCAFPNCEKGRAESERADLLPSLELQVAMRIEVQPRSLRAIAENVAELAIAKGWQKPDWDNFVPKLAFAITELNEAVDWVHGRGKDPVGIELADTAIRLLAIVQGIWPDAWSPGRIEGRRPTRRIGLYQPIEVGVWPIVRHICEAIECWRKNDPRYGKKDAMISTEMAILETFRLADSLGINLITEIETKTLVNALRPHLHGKGQNVG